MQEFEYTSEEDEEWNRLESKQSFPFPTRQEIERLERASRQPTKSKSTLLPIDQPDAED